MKRTLTYFFAALLGGVLALGGHEAMRNKERSVATAPDQPPASAHFTRLPGTLSSAAPVDFVPAAETSVNAVVHVTTETMVQYSDPFRDFFWGYRSPTPQPREGVGSGVIIASDGYIVTNNHVVEGADKITIHLNDGRSFPGKVIGRDPSTDIALLKVDADGLPTLPFGDSDGVKVGEWVLAVGNPMNLTSTVTAGIVSAKARNINLLQYDPGRDVFPIESFIQTDAAVNPGNSGGALVNTAGALVGINTAIASTTGQYTGYSFAVPANIVKKVTNDLLEYGSVQRAYIGVSIRNMDQDLAGQARMDRIRGVFVNGITEGGAAQKAGIEEGDVILKVGTMEVNNVPQLQEQVGKFRPGDEVTVTIMRDGRERVMDMELRGKDGTNVLATTAPKQAALVLGAQLAQATSSELKALKLENGVKVVAIESGKLRTSGIREGFIITRIDDQPIRQPEDIERAITNKRGGVLIEGIYPNGMKAYYGLGI
ncbi:MAG: Do family serine endopeptidase [Flavobacteriales bacterium]|nr:Do family serine endopeptidase [Flavobacteriales bacterium]MBP6699116.1 Do family serine endopeptidase [Flavobacteriales bacterium]